MGKRVIIAGGAGLAFSALGLLFGIRIGMWEWWVTVFPACVIGGLMVARAELNE